MSSLPRYSFCEKQRGNLSDGPVTPPAAFLSAYERALNAELNNIDDAKAVTAQDQDLDYPAKRYKRKRSLLFILAVVTMASVIATTAVVASLLAAKGNAANNQESPSTSPSTLSTSTLMSTFAQTSSLAGLPITTTTVLNLEPTTITQVSTETIFTKARATETTSSDSSPETTTTTTTKKDTSVTTSSFRSPEQASTTTATSSSTATTHSSSINTEGVTIVPLQPTTVAGKSTLLPWTAQHTSWLRLG